MIDASFSERTWYEDTARRAAPAGALTGRAEAEVCVIGGGLAGLTTSLELSRRGVSTVLLEAKRIAWGASGRNGGFVSNGFALGMDGVVARVGEEGARALYQLSRFGTEYVRREIAETDPSIKMGEGWQSCIRYSNAAEKRQWVAEMQETYGQEMEFLDVAETRARVNSPRYFQSSYDPTAFHMHPLRYALMIAGKAEAAGAKLFENSPALSVGREGAAHVVRTQQGEVRARHVVFCVSSLDRGLHAVTGRRGQAVREFPRAVGWP